MGPLIRGHGAGLFAQLNGHLLANPMTQRWQRHATRQAESVAVSGRKDPMHFQCGVLDCVASIRDLSCLSGPTITGGSDLGQEGHFVFRRRHGRPSR
ncbi:hypothetical protein MRX96_019043 [Rhipicephalus microplus]